MITRAERMVDTAPEYYHESELYTGIVKVEAAELDKIDAANKDLKAQLFIRTATWGLKYWEELLKIPTIETDSYEIRRSRVLSAWRGVGKFSAALLRTVSESYSGGAVDVKVNLATYQITIKFVGKYGLPPNLSDLQYMIDKIVHAHMEVIYEYSYRTWDETDVRGWTWDAQDAQNLTWNSFESI